MVNNGNNQKIVRNTRGAYPHDKDDAIELANKIADMKAKWKAFEDSAKEIAVKIVDDDEADKLKAKEEFAKLAKEAAEAEKIKAEKKAQLQAELDALDD